MWTMCIYMWFISIYIQKSTSQNRQGKLPQSSAFHKFSCCCLVSRGSSPVWFQRELTGCHELETPAQLVMSTLDSGCGPKDGKDWEGLKVWRADDGQISDSPRHDMKTHEQSWFKRGWLLCMFLYDWVVWISKVLLLHDTMKNPGAKHFHLPVDFPPWNRSANFPGDLWMCDQVPGSPWAAWGDGRANQGRHEKMRKKPR